MGEDLSHLSELRADRILPASPKHRRDQHDDGKFQSEMEEKPSEKPEDDDANQDTPASGPPAHRPVRRGVYLDFRA